MQYTENLNLNKPGPSDQYNIQHFNDNFDVLDSHVHAVEEAVSSTEIEITEKVNEAKQFPNMEGVCPVEKGGTGANNAQNALVNLHGSVPVVSEIPSTAEVTFMDRTPADVELGTPEVLDVKGITLDRLADAVYERIRTGGLFTNVKNGLVPKTGASTGVRFLSSEGIWRTPDGASTVYEATASSSWAVNGDTILRIKGDCTSVINDASVFGTRLTIINETESAQNVSLYLSGGSAVKSIPAKQSWYYVWTNYWNDGVGLSNKVASGDTRPVTSNAVFQERARGMVPDGVSIDDMVGPEWVGNWNVKPETLGHKPYIGGGLGYLTTWLYLEVKYYPAGTEQVMKTFDDVAVSRRFCPPGSGWLNHSDTMLSGHTYGGWYTHYDTGGIVRGSKDYGSGLNGCLVRMGFSYGQPYLFVYNNENAKVAGQDFVFAHVSKIQQALWEWGHFPDEYISFCSGSFINISGWGMDRCYAALYSSIDSLWMTGQVATDVNRLYAKVYANGLNR